MTFCDKSRKLRFFLLILQNMSEKDERSPIQLTKKLFLTLSRLSPRLSHQKLYSKGFRSFFSQRKSHLMYSLFGVLRNELF